VNIAKHFDWGLKCFDDNGLSLQNVLALIDELTDSFSLLGEGSQVGYFFLTFLGL
jgi:hypothetical protein